MSMITRLRIGSIKFCIDLIDHKFFGTLFARIYKRLFINIPSKEMVIFDVGGHEGESVELFRKLFPGAQIHCFEPDKRNFEVINKKFCSTPNVYLNNFGIGSKNEFKQFYSNILSYTSSFKKIDLNADWTKVKSRTLGVKPEELIVETQNVRIRTIDDYVEEHAIKKIHLLKIDAEGYEFECLQGSQNSLMKKIIDSIQLEVHFDDMYKDHHTLTDLESILHPYNYRLFQKKTHFFLKCLEVIFRAN